MPGVYGGELFGNNNPTPYEIYRDQQAIEMQQKRLDAQDARDQRRNDAKVGNVIRSTFDKNHFTTGTPADPVINEMLLGMVDKYARLYMDSKGSLDSTDISLPMQGDVMRIKAYQDNVNVIKSNAMKGAEAVAKAYPGFNKQQLYQKAMDRALYKDGQVIQDVEDFNLSKDFVNDVINEDYGSLNLGPEGMYSGFEDLKSTKEQKGIVTRDKLGVDRLISGEAKYMPRYQDLTYDSETGEPKIKLRTMPVSKPDGTPYLDKGTGKAVDIIDEPTYQEMIQNRLLNSRINQLADQRFDGLAAKGVQLNESDRKIFRREAATQQLNSAFENSTSFTAATRQPLPARHHYKVGRSFEAIPFNLDAAPQDADGNKDLTGQLGGFTIKDPKNRLGNTSAEIWLTPNGGLIVRSYELDKLGNRSNQRPDQLYYGKAAKNFVESNNGWSGNNKKDLYKLLDLFDGTGEEPNVPSSPWMKDVFQAPGNSQSINPPKASTNQPVKKTSKKQKLNW